MSISEQTLRPPSDPAAMFSSVSSLSSLEGVTEYRQSACKCLCAKDSSNEHTTTQPSSCLCYMLSTQRDNNKLTMFPLNSSQPAPRASYQKHSMGYDTSSLSDCHVNHSALVSCSQCSNLDSPALLVPSSVPMQRSPPSYSLYAWARTPTHEEPWSTLAMSDKRNDHVSGILDQQAKGIRGAE